MNIEGLVSDIECKVLYDLAKNCKNAIVEIGSFKGKSTVWLAKGSKAGYGVKVYAIDPHNGMGDWSLHLGEINTFEDFKNNIKNAGVEDIVAPLVKTSAEAIGDILEPIGLIFVDGGHEYKDVKLDFDLWFPKLAEHGIIAFHDTDWIGPKQVVRDLVHNYKETRSSRRIGSIWFAEKVDHNSRTDRFRNRYILLVGHTYETAYELNLPKPIRETGKKILKLIQ